MNALENIERQLRASVAARHPHPSPSRSPQGRARGEKASWLRARRRPVRVAVLAVAIVGLLVAVGLVTSDSGSGPSRAAAATLQRLARIAATGPSLVPGPGQYLYVDSLNYYSSNAIGRAGTDCITYALDNRQVWKTADGSGLLRDTTSPSTYTSSQDRHTCLSTKLGHTTTRATSNSWFAANCFPISPISDPAALSHNPQTLLHEIDRDGGGAMDASQEFGTIGSLLEETDASPGLRAAIYRAAALIPGVQVLGPVKDHSGRPGLGIALTTHQERDELIFNPRTAALLGEQVTSTLPGASGWTVYRSSRLVDHLQYRSPVSLTPPCQHSGAGYGRNVPGGSVMTGRPGR